MLLASCFGVGYLPVCPGTFASLAAIGLYALLGQLNLFVQIVCVCVVFLIGVHTASQAETVLNQKDPSQVVIDEVVGYLITMGFLPFNLIAALIGFFLFRFFDILKPFPVRRFEKIPGGWGIMLDDTIAGIYASLSLRLILMIR